MQDEEIKADKELQDLIDAEVKPLKDKIAQLEREIELQPLNEKIKELDKKLHETG
jgi:tetrahydromethanopterin S-methyltransferase subunit B